MWQDKGLMRCFVTNQMERFLLLSRGNIRVCAIWTNIFGEINKSRMAILKLVPVSGIIKVRIMR